MTNQEIIDAINRYQKAVNIHPLTCGNDSKHTNLTPSEEGGKVFLKCPDCDYTQTFIPEYVLKF